MSGLGGTMTERCPAAAETARGGGRLVGVDVTNDTAGVPAHKVEQFWSRVEQVGDCWEWRGFIKENGYGQFSLGKRRPVLAHRFAYLTLVGEIPEGLQLDHLCRNRACVNPWHLDPVTPQENTRRGAILKTHCPSGHPYTGENLRYNGSARVCRECDNARRREARAAQGPLRHNMRDKTHCKRGHEFTPENTHIRASDGARVCIECRRELGRQKWHRLNAARQVVR